PAARSRDPVPRRADHRARCAVEACRARLRAAAPPRAGRDGAAHDSRHARRRGAGRTRHRHRPGARADRRPVREPARRRSRRTAASHRLRRTCARDRDAGRHGPRAQRALARARFRPGENPGAEADRRHHHAACRRRYPCRRTCHRGGDHALLRPARRERGMTMGSARPYLAAFRARFQLMLQYRAAALAGFATQLWWGAIRILVFAAFYGVNAAAAPIGLTDVVTYVWLGQALLALQPWLADPEVGQAVRSGGVGYDRLRPLDASGYWYARTAGWMLARALPRAVLMVLAAGVVMPLVGLGAWAWRPPSSVAAALLFVPAFVLMAAL